MRVKKIFVLLLTLLVSYFLMPNLNSFASENNSITKKIIYLTFDDGPSIYTKELLNVLKKHNVSATFFVCVNKRSDFKTLKRMKDENHLIGVHSITHNYPRIYANEEAFWQEIDEEIELIKNKIDYDVKIMRFPGGSGNYIAEELSPGIMKRLCRQTKERGMEYFDWNASSGDNGGQYTDLEKITFNMLVGISQRDQAIVLSHDTYKNIVVAIDLIIAWGKEHGYEFRTLNADEYNYRFTKISDDEDKK